MDLFTQIDKAISDMKNKPAIVSGDKIFISRAIWDECYAIWYRWEEHLINKRISLTLCSEQDEANVLVTDTTGIEYLCRLFKQSASSTRSSFDIEQHTVLFEFVNSIKYEQKVIDLCDLTIDIHRGLNKIDEEMYKSLREMITSNDVDTYVLGTSIMGSTDREDPYTIEYLYNLLAEIGKRNHDIENSDVHEIKHFLHKKYPNGYVEKTK